MRLVIAYLPLYQSHNPIWFSGTRINIFSLTLYNVNLTQSNSFLYSCWFSFMHWSIYRVIGLYQTEVWWIIAIVLSRQTILTKYVTWLWPLFVVADLLQRPYGLTQLYQLRLARLFASGKPLGHLVLLTIQLLWVWTASCRS